MLLKSCVEVGELFSLWFNGQTGKYWIMLKQQSIFGGSRYGRMHETITTPTQVYFGSAQNVSFASIFTIPLIF